MSRQKTLILLLFALACAVPLAHAEKGKVGPFVQLDSDDIKLKTIAPIHKVYVIFNVGDAYDDIDILKFIQALQGRLFKKKFEVPESERKADVVITLNIEKFQQEYWAGLPSAVGQQRRVLCLKVDAVYKTRMGTWTKEFIAHKGYWTYTGDAYFRDTTTHDLSRAIVNPLHDYPKEKAFIQAASEGDLKAVRDYIDDNINIDADNDDGDTALIAATRNRQSEVVRFLITENADVNIRNDDGWTPLTFAATNGDIAIAELLLQNKAKVNIATRDGDSPLDLAVMEGDRMMVTMLLPYGASTEHALVLAKRSGYTELARIISDYNEQEKKSTDFNCSYFAGLIRNEYQERIQSAIKDNLLSVDFRDKTCVRALLAAAEKGNIEVIDYFLDKGFSVNESDSKGNTLLALSAGGGHKEAVEMLVKKGADLYHSGSSALASAAANGYKNVADYLIPKLADINAWCETGDADGSTPLSEAARTGHAEIIELLLDKGARIDTKNQDGKTALMIAALEGRAKIVELLLSKGADIGRKDKDGSTAMDLVNKARMKNTHINYRDVIDNLKREEHKQTTKREKLISR